jgi:hypothetical protein
MRLHFPRRTGNLRRDRVVRVDAATIERVVKGLIADFGLPCELVAVAGAGDQWEVAVRDTRRQLRRFVVRASTPTSLRRAIKEELDGMMDEA